MKLIKKLGTRLNKKGIKQSWAIFKCPTCLQEFERQLDNGKKQKSCGSIQCEENKGSFRHGQTKTRLYNIWSLIKQRCSNLKASGFKNYGGRGIIICPEWANDYITFRDWAINNGYQEGLQINRINNDGNYEPSNCNFKTLKENIRHRRNQKIKNIEMANEIRSLYKTNKYTQKELTEKFNVSASIINQIINNKRWKN